VEKKSTGENKMVIDKLKTGAFRRKTQTKWSANIGAARHKIAAPPFVIQLAKEKPQAKRQTTLDNHRKTLALADSLKMKPCIAFAHRL